MVSGCSYAGKGQDWLDYGIELGGGAVVTLTNNAVTGCVAGRERLELGGHADHDLLRPGTSATLTGNLVTGNSYGVAVGYDGADVSTVTVHDNDLSGNTDLALYTVSDTRMVDASANWWGTNSPTDVAGLLYGTVDYTPWLHNAGDVDPVAPGFQGDHSALDVDDDSPQTAGVTRINEAIGLVSGSTVHVAAGLYTEQIVVTTSNLTIQGAGRLATTVQSPATLTTSIVTPSVKYPVVLVNGVTGVTVRDLTVDGLGLGNANYQFVGVAFWNAGGELLDADVKHVEDTPFSGAQHGVSASTPTTTPAGRIASRSGGVNVTDFQKNAMALSGTGLTVERARLRRHRGPDPRR